MQARTTLCAIACAALIAAGCGGGDDDSASAAGTGGAAAHPGAGGGGGARSGGTTNGSGKTDGSSSGNAGHSSGAMGGAGTGGASGSAGSGSAGDGSGMMPRDGDGDAGTNDGGMTPADQGGTRFGPVHMGSYNVGPVDWAETVYHNSCAPYPPELQTSIGENLAGIDNSLNGNGMLCDACAIITTRLGKSLLVHIVTTGVSKAPGDMDLSPNAYDTIHEDDPQGTPDVPRPMSWQLASCPRSGNVLLQYQTQANPWWTSFWARGATHPTTKIEVKSANHADFFALRRETDGTWNDDGGFGMGAFELRITGDGADAPISAQFDSFEAGALVDTGVQFR